MYYIWQTLLEEQEVEKEKELADSDILTLR